jgi:hypothetical protein
MHTFCFQQVTAWKEALWKTTCETQTQRDENSKPHPFKEAGCVSMDFTEMSQVTFLKTYSKPSLIQLQLIRMSDSPDRNTKNAVHS